MVTRGNVAIYCYNALTAKTWDVISSEDDKLTSGASKTETILAKYFSDFTNEAGKMKLVEDATVKVSGAIKNTIGANQVELELEDTYLAADGSDIGIAGFIDAEEAPRRGKEDVTYIADNGLNVVAYVPAEVANIDSLTNKKVDVIFGRDNEVAYLVVTDEIFEEAYVTAWKCASDYSEAEITIDGEVYDVTTSTTNPVEVSVYGHDIATGIEVMNTILSSRVVGTNSTSLKKNVVANFTLNSKDEIESIDFKLATYNNENTTEHVYVTESVVTKVTAKKITTVGGSSLTVANLEKEDPRIIKNGEIATIDDIEAGNVLTIVKVGDTQKTETIYVTDNTVEGMISNYTSRTNAVNVDGEKYFASVKVFVNADGEIEKITEAGANTLPTTFDDKDVTIYLNLVGEIAAVVGESEATGMTLGVITNDYKDELYTDANDEDVNYLKVKVLTEDGTKKIYKIYSSKKTTAEKSIEDDATHYDRVKAFKAGTVVVFEADANKVIKADKINEPVVSSTAKYTFGSLNEVYAHEYAISGKNVDATISVTVDGESKDIKIDDARNTIDGNKFTSSTVVFNKNAASIETITEWDTLIKRASDPDTFVATKDNANVWLFTQNNRIAYMVVDVVKAGGGYGTTDTQYGVLLNSTTSDDEEKLDYIVTMLVDGKTVEFECADNLEETYNFGDVISFALTDNELSSPDLLVGVAYLSELEDVEDDDTLPDETNNNVAAALIPDNAKLDYIKVKDVDEEDNYIVFENAASTLAYLASDYVAYDLATGEVYEEDLVGSYVLLADANKDGEYQVVIIVK